MYSSMRDGLQQDREPGIFCGHSPGLFHALICFLLYMRGRKMGIEKIEIMFATFESMNRQAMRIRDT